jgi:hypothetical protein
MCPDLVLVAVLSLDLVAVVKSHHLVEGRQDQMVEVLVFVLETEYLLANN